MLLAKLPSLSFLTSPLPKFQPHFSRFCFSTTNSPKQPFLNADYFNNLQQRKVQQYFQQYQKQIEKQSVVKEFRKQLFTKTNQSPQMKQFNHVINEQQKHIHKLLEDGTKSQINKYSKKVMEHVLNRRSMFKGKTTQDVFRDYADYSAYKSNTVTIQERNYTHMDNLDRYDQIKNVYQFIDKLPPNYKEKKQAKQTIAQKYPAESYSMSISQYGRRLQKQEDELARHVELENELRAENEFKDKRRYSLQDKQQSYMEDQKAKKLPMRLTMMSTEAINKIYDLYLQGWSVREISRRFGILPMRTKFYVWCRARLYNQLIPKYGLKFYLYVMKEQSDEMEKNYVVDYGIDLQRMQHSDRYEQIVSWSNKAVDSQRTPQQYTQALQKLQERKKFSKYDLVQVGQYGKENKRYLLKDWRIYRGRKSDDYFLKNKIFKHFMVQKSKIKNVYY